MNKKLTWKIVLIIVLILLAFLTLYPPSQKLRSGIDLAGGVSLIYQIDTHGLEENEKRGLSQKMITVLQRRIDPANIQNLIWLPQGNTRFEIQMPLASAEARSMRDNYEAAEQTLMNKNVSRSKVMQALTKPAANREELFKNFSQGDPNRLSMLEKLAELYDKRTELQNNRDNLAKERENTANAVTSAGIDIEKVKSKVAEWADLDTVKLTQAIDEFTDVNDNIPVLEGYVKAYSEWAKSSNELVDIQPQYLEALNAIDNLNLTQEQLNLCLEMSNKAGKRDEKIRELKAAFPDRVGEIDNVVKAYDKYSPYRGRLDDPKDLQRMLKGAGILEFRILPTRNPAYVDIDAMDTYVERLQEKGPEYASYDDYKWCEIENYEEWGAADKEQYPSIVAQFGSKYYVLASNKSEEVILHSTDQDAWKLEKAFPTSDDRGLRAIGILFNIQGGKIFGKITNENIGRPFCILLDNIAISAPKIDSRVGRNGVITGGSTGFTPIQVEDMVNKLNAGSLPARLVEQPISVNTIGPSIGTENRDQGIGAGIYGLIAVIVCMAIYYTFAGGIADVALLLNLLFILAIMAGIRATFTLPGIAGLILTIGMSVDANVLIFERIREEQEKGSSLRVSIANGYQKAFSTIFDSNLTTFITAAILYWRASEEVRGFAIVLMLGILSSMFTALFITRVIFDLLLNKRILKDHLFMLRLIHNANVNWMKARPIFFSISGVLIISGLLVFFSRNDVNKSKYDIEFTGGTSAQIILAEGVNLSQQEVQSMIRQKLPAANVYSVGESGKQFEITTTETNRITVAITSNRLSSLSAEQVKKSIQNAQKHFSDKLTGLIITKDSGNADTITIATSQMNQSVVREILNSAFPDAQMSELQVDELVNDAILDTFAEKLEIQQNLQPRVVSEEKITAELISSYPELSDFLGGIKLTCEIERSASLKDIKDRISNLQFKPDTRDLKQYNYEIRSEKLTPISDLSQLMKKFVYVSADEEAGIRALSDDEWAAFAQNEKTKILSATETESSLPRVRQFDPSVGAEQKKRTMIAIVLSLFSIIAYIWIRFGNVRYGIAAIVALVHDVCITLGVVTASVYLANTFIGNLLLIGDFKINLTIIAAFLTLIGYSLNDTIVVFDRIRENRGKARKLTPQMITDSINQTISRTIMTSFTTFIVVLIMYIFGGPGLRGFSFAIGFGIIIGTYSSIAIAAPILLIGAKTEKAKDSVMK
ncbi:MAG: protein translocase subunit SecD [Sedimentisphaerales bacterium]|nr:protein translocase subunit SecD [Sedimentisphaerales bacterium]